MAWTDYGNNDPVRKYEESPSVSSKEYVAAVVRRGRNAVEEFQILKNSTYGQGAMEYLPGGIGNLV